MNGYNIGDKIKIKDLSKFDHGESPTINEEMALLSGETLKIEEFSGECIVADGWNWNFKWVESPYDLEEVKTTGYKLK
jgi:hypothetical protein